MTPITRNLWRDLTPDCSVEPGALPSAVRTFATTFQGCLFFGTLVETNLENGGARLDIRAKTSAEGSWEKVAELALTHRTDVNQGGVRYARVFTGIVADGANDAELLRIDVVGGGFTAAVTSADGVVFEACQAVDIGAPVLDVAVVATQIQGIVALARKIGTEASGLWKATGPRSSQWQELESQPPALSRAYGAGAVAFAGAALWVAFRNPVRGFEIWSAPWVPGSLVWVKSLEDGAWKWAANSDVYAMTAFGEACYAATGVDDAQQEKLAPFHRRAFELLRIYPGGDWDLLVGTPVFTPGGLRAPLSAKGPGLDQIWNDRVFSLISHAGELFLLGRNLDTLKLWHSQDGESWDSLPLPDSPTLGTWTAPDLVSTPFGLAIGGQASDVAKPNSPRLFLMEV
jgi:hypothetical protein